MVKRGRHDIYFSGAFLVRDKSKRIGREGKGRSGRLGEVVEFVF